MPTRRTFCNLITLSSFLCGIFSIYYAIGGRPLISVYLIFIAMVLDFLDGKVARLTKTVSEFGFQMDSLVDIVSCGVAPVVLICTLFFKEFGNVEWFSSALYSSCSLVRLARYNVQAKGQKSSFFCGLPVPAACGLVMSFILLCLKLENVSLLSFTPIVMIVAALLMVSRIKYPTFLGTPLARKIFALIVLIGLVFSLRLHYIQHIVLFGYFTGYVLKGIYLQIVKILKIL